MHLRLLDLLADSFCCADSGLLEAVADCRVFGGELSPHNGGHLRYQFSGIHRGRLGRAGRFALRVLVNLARICDSMVGH